MAWQPPAWNTVGEAGPNQQTPDLSPVIQEIVNRTGWGSGNDLALVITGSGQRTAESFRGDPNGAALLHVEYELFDDGTLRIDLDADNSSGASGRDFATTFLVGGAPVPIADSDIISCRGGDAPGLGWAAGAAGTSVGDPGSGIGDVGEAARALKALSTRGKALSRLFAASSHRRLQRLGKISDLVPCEVEWWTNLC